MSDNADRMMEQADRATAYARKCGAAEGHLLMLLNHVEFLLKKHPGLAKTPCSPGHFLALEARAARAYLEAEAPYSMRADKAAAR